MSARDARGPGLFGRLGLAVVRPRAALAIAGDRRHAGRSGSDLLIAIGVLLAATQLRGLVTAVWLGAAVSWGLGTRAAINLLAAALTVDLGLLLLGAVVVWAAAGPRRELGRAFDLASVTILPLVFVDLAGRVVVGALGLGVSVAVVAALSIVAYLWTLGLIVLAALEVRRGGAPAAPEAARRPARIAGGALAAIAALGFAFQAVWLVRHTDRVRPMTSGDHAPAFALPAVGPGGQLGAPVTLASTAGKVTVLDFWATWCGPCRAALPHLDALARHHPEIAVIAINIDDPAEARAMFDRHGYAMTLVEDDGTTGERYGVSTIPHTVVLDRAGTVRHVFRGGGVDLEPVIDALEH